MDLQKRGVSPLIATVLLIAFAVSLGSVIINWGLNLDLGNEDKCKNVKIELREVDEKQACYGGFGRNGYIQFAVENSGTVDVPGLAIWITGAQGTSIYDLDDISIKRAQIFEKNDKEVKYDFIQYGDLKKVQLIPKLRTGEAYEICPNGAAKAEVVGVCGKRS